MMLWWRKGRKKPDNSAAKAKERLSFMIAVENEDGNAPQWLPAMKSDLIEVISKYVSVNQDKLRVELSKDGDRSLLEVVIGVDIDEAKAEPSRAGGNASADSGPEKNGKTG